MLCRLVFSCEILNGFEVMVDTKTFLTVQQMINHCINQAINVFTHYRLELLVFKIKNIQSKYHIDGMVSSDPLDDFESKHNKKNIHYICCHEH